MNFATKKPQAQRFIWVVWLIVFLVALLSPAVAPDNELPGLLLEATIQNRGAGARYAWRGRFRVGGNFVINNGRKSTKIMYPKIRIDDMTDHSKKPSERSGYSGKWHWLSFLLILPGLVFLVSGCTPNPPLQRYENSEAGIRLEKPANWKAEYYERNGQILLDAKRYFWDKRGPLVEIHGGACLSNSKADRPDLEDDIERIRNLYGLDSVSVIQEPAIIRTGDFEASKAVIEIPIAKMQGDDNRIRVENRGPGALQTIEVHAIRSQGGNIWAYVYKSGDEAMDAQAQEIIESIQLDGSTTKILSKTRRLIFYNRSVCYVSRERVNISPET
ncbi:MAG: hypothetical protein AB1894_11115 [Chloroflexota bacterium]